MFHNTNAAFHVIEMVILSSFHEGEQQAVEFVNLYCSFVTCCSNCMMRELILHTRPTIFVFPPYYSKRNLIYHKLPITNSAISTK